MANLNGDLFLISSIIPLGDDLENANMDDGMRPNKLTPISLVCPQCEKKII